MSVVFAASSAWPDREFADTAALARWLVARRDRAWPRATFVLRSAVLGRDALPAGGCIAVKVRTAAGVHRLGYALIGDRERPGCYAAEPIAALRQALDMAEAANAVRQQEEDDAA